MQETIRLFEAIDRVTIRVRGNSFPVLRNPSEAGLQKLLRDARPNLRGILSGDDLYVWDAWVAIHREVAAELGLPNHGEGSIDIFRGHGGRPSVVTINSADDLRNPALRRILQSGAVLVRRHDSNDPPLTLRDFDQAAVREGQQTMRAMMRLVEGHRATDFIDAFYDAYEASGLDKVGHVSLAAFGPKVEISHIGIDDGHQGKGLGSKTLQLICDLADQNGITLMASPADDADGEDGLPDRDALADWYERYDFERHPQGRMVRLPEAL